ncbi:lipase/thioesterase [Penicillium brasilianum]|uniref:Lipase/thioesterase n=1 Tax=Penicillium brasilianum TaxID=104259 RepID=A0A1S9S1T5_PENBI|nr:lipase/thioesterase [Penicillium brasilianum]
MSTIPTTAVVIEPLSISDKFSLVWLLRCTTNFASFYLSNVEVVKLHWRQKLALAYLQASRVTLTRKQQAQSRKLLTGPRIQQYCRRYNLAHRAVSVHDNALYKERDIPTPVLHFVKGLAAQPEGPTIFYSHGGGYHSPIKEQGHIPLALQFAVACKAKQVVFLEYSLSPEQQYPCQLIQAVAGLRYLLEQELIHPENIILSGDSAGGHLTASLLTHIIHPSPYAPPIDLYGHQFKAVLLVSPWMAMSEEQIKTLPRAPNDFLTRESIVRFSTMFKPGLDEVWSNRCEMQDAVAVWKKLFPTAHEHAICRKAMLAVGTSEVLFDSCVTFGQECIGCETIYVDDQSSLDLVRETDFVLAIAPGEAHVQPGMDCALGYHDGRMMRAISTFLEAC